MESRATRERARRNRIELRLHADATERQHRELGAFVRFCVFRIERELGESERWVVIVAPGSAGFRSTVTVHDGPLALQTTGTGLDGALAVWDALCRLEQALREGRSARIGRPRRDPTEQFDRG